MKSEMERLRELKMLPIKQLDDPALAEQLKKEGYSEKGIRRLLICAKEDHS